MKSVFTAALAAALFCASSGLAHITLERGETPAGAAYKAVLRVGHGCEGAATKAIRVRIPDGVIAVHPMPKPGWTLATKVEPYEQPVAYYDQMLTEGVREIAWTGGDLPDAWYDEFVFRAMMPAGEAGTVVYFPVVQECATGVHRWIEIPEAGRSPDDYKEPAPGVTLTPAGAH